MKFEDQKFNDFLIRYKNFSLDEIQGCLDYSEVQEQSFLETLLEFGFFDETSLQHCIQDFKNFQQEEQQTEENQETRPLTAKSEELKKLHQPLMQEMQQMISSISLEAQLESLQRLQQILQQAQLNYSQIQEEIADEDATAYLQTLWNSFIPQETQKTLSQEMLALFGTPSKKKKSSDLEKIIKNENFWGPLQELYASFNQGLEKYQQGDLKGAQEDFRLFLEQTESKKTDPHFEEVRQQILKKFPELGR